MAKNETTPLKQKVDNNGDLTENILQSDLFKDQAFGLDIAAFTSPTTPPDTEVIDERISKIQKPVSETPWEKQAAYYRQKGEGDVLRRQKNVDALFTPAINLWKEREAAAIAKFELLKQQMPEFDDSVIFGETGPNKVPMPVGDEIKNISMSVKEDLRTLSRMNVNDPRYDELRKKIEKDQDVIVQFNEINQKLLAIRNDLGEDGLKMGNNNAEDWSATVPENERRMWMDIYNSNGENIEVIDGKLTWVDPGGEEIDLGPVTEEEKSLRRMKIVFAGIDHGGIEGGTDVVRDKVMNEKDKNHSLAVLGGIGAHGRSPNDPGYWTGGYLLQEPDISFLQQALVNLGYDLGSTKDHPDGVDGKWGKKSKAAYELYLKDRDGLEKKHGFWEEFLPEHEYTMVKTSGKNVDLSTIGDGPRQKDGVAYKQHLSTINTIHTAIGAGADPNGVGNAKNLFDIAMVQVEDDFDGLGNEGQASLLFDGIDRVGKDKEALDVNTFLNDLLINQNMGYEDMSELERMNAIEDLKRNGMEVQYDDGEGNMVSLRKQFKDFYLNEIKNIASETPQKRTKQKVKGKGKDKVKKITKSRFEAGTYGSLDEIGVESLYQNFESGVVGGWTRQDDTSWINKEGRVISGKELLKAVSDEIGYDLMADQNLLIRIDKDAAKVNPFLQFHSKVGQTPSDLESITLTQEEERELHGTNLDFIVDDIWSPDKPSGYGTNENGKALFDYILKEFDGSDITQWLRSNRGPTKGWTSMDLNSPNGQKYRINVKGEKIEIWRWSKKAGKYVENKGWTADSYGGRGYDKEDIEEIFKKLGLSKHLQETKS